MIHIANVTQGYTLGFHMAPFQGYSRSLSVLLFSRSV